MLVNSGNFLPVLGSQLTDLSRLQQQFLLQLVGRQRVLQKLDLYTRRLVQHLVERQDVKSRKSDFR